MNAGYFIDIFSAGFDPVVDFSNLKVHKGPTHLKEP